MHNNTHIAAIVPPPSTTRPQSWKENCMSGQKDKVHLSPNVSSSSHDCGRRGRWQWHYGSNMSIIIIVDIRDL